jgi:hypothetical protein
VGGGSGALRERGGLELDAALRRRPALPEPDVLAEERSPGETTGASGIVWPDELGVGSVVVPVLLQINSSVRLTGGLGGGVQLWNAG